MFFIGWLWDYPDADNFVFPYLHSQGAYGGRGSFDVLGEVSDHIDELIEAGAKEPDPAKRQAIYYELQQIQYEQALCLMTHDSTSRRWMRTDIGGFAYNPTWSRWNWDLMYRADDATIDYEWMSAFDYKIEEW